MATSTCSKCGSRSFELEEVVPAGSKFKIMFIQCSSCGCVVGTTDFYNTSSLLGKIAEKMGFDLFR